MTLAEYVSANLEKPFAWGSQDCVLFAMGWVNYASGNDHLAEIRRWSTARQAMRIVKEVGGLERALDARFRRINSNLANDGDLAIYNGCMCLFSGPYIIGPGREKLEFIDRMKAECAWSY